MGPKLPRQRTLMMWFRLLRLSVILTFGFGVVVGLVRLRPAENVDMRAFLLPSEDCAAPCFLGVQPGTTTLPQAARILQANDWIDHVSQSAHFYDLLWSGSQPAFIDTSAPNYYMPRPDNRVGQMRLRTSLRLGDVIAVLGEPDLRFSRLARSGIFHTIIYTRLGLEISGFAPCSMPYREIWYIPVEIRLHDIVYDSAQWQHSEWALIGCT